MPLNHRLIVILLSVTVLVTYRAYGASPGTTGAQIAEIAPVARAAGMGGAFCAVADGAESVYYNPAGLGNVLTGLELPFGNNSMYGGTSYQYFGFAYNLHDVRVGNMEDSGVIAAYFNSITIGSIEKTNALGARIGDFSPTDEMITAGYAKTVYRTDEAGAVMAGAIGKMIQEKYGDDKFSGTAFDAGLLWQNVLNYPFSVAAAAQNMGNSISYASKSYSLPLNFKLGGAVSLLNNEVLLAADYNRPQEGKDSYNLGAEYWLMNTIALRAGYDSKSDLATGLTAGVGFRLSQVDAIVFYAHEITLDYAFIQSKEEVDSLHWVSINLKLGAE